MIYKKFLKNRPKKPIFDLFLAHFKKILIKQRISRNLVVSYYFFDTKTKSLL